MVVDLALALNALVAVLLVITIAYAILLSRRLDDMRAGGNELERAVGQFNTAVEDARSALQGVRRGVTEATEALEENLSRSRAMRDELTYLLTRADSVADRLTEGMTGRRPTLDRPAPDRLHGDLSAEDLGRFGEGGAGRGRTGRGDLGVSGLGGEMQAIRSSLADLDESELLPENPAIKPRSGRRSRATEQDGGSDERIPVSANRAAAPRRGRGAGKPGSKGKPGGEKETGASPDGPIDSPDDPAEESVRSKAERELLKALREAR